MVGVLVFVHQHIAEFVLVIGQYLRLLLQKRHGVVNDVVKVQGIGGMKLFGVGSVYLGDAAHFPVVFRGVSFGEVLRALVFVLGTADHSQDALWLEGFLVQVLLLHDVLDDPLGVIGIVNGEVLVKSDAVNVPPQDADAGGVEGGGPDVVGLGAQPGGQAVLQLSRRLVGKCNSDDLPRTGHIHGA